MLCSLCDTKIPKGALRCPKCKKFNIGTTPMTRSDGGIVIPGVQLLSEVEEVENQYIATGPWDPCFGQSYETKVCGLVKGCEYIVAGIPGAGKSTLALQLSATLAGSLNAKVCYIGAEERLKEIKTRAKRIQLPNLNLINGISALGGLQQDLGSVLLALRPAGVILDSVKGLSLDTLDEEVEYCKALKNYAVELDCPVIVITHATKQDDVAGLLSLQHAGDCTCVLYVNDDGGKGCEPTRTFVSIKNRLGPLREVNLLMTELGLVELPAKNKDDEDEEDEEDEEEDS